MIAQREPLLWLQLIAIGAIPLELLLLSLVLAGADLGPIPAFERLFTWALAVLAPTLVLWQRPADWGSLLLLRRPVKQRSESQRQLSSLQQGLIPRLTLLTGTAALLAVFWWIDQSSILIRDLSPLQGSSRLVTLLTAIPLLALVLWQWHQLTQSLWLLSCSDQSLAQAPSLSDEQLKLERLSLGLSLLNMPELMPKHANTKSDSKTEET
ncbi:MAG: low-complexity tail membrane protein [Prochlorococcus sp.]